MLPVEKNSKGKEHKLSHYNIDIKEEGESYFVSGFLASTHPDNAANEELGVVGDILDETAIDKIVDTINDKDRGNFYAPLISYRHDWIRENNETLPPAGIIKGKAEKRNTDDGQVGAFVTAEVLKSHPKHEQIIYDLEKGVLPGFSIEFETDSERYDIVELNGKSYRHVKDLDYYGSGFAHARAIANPLGSQIVDLGWKELKEKIQKKSEEIQMDKKEEEEKKKADEKKKSEMSEEEKKKAEKKKADEKKKAEEKDKKKEPTTEEKEFEAFKKYKVEAKEKEMKENLFKEMKEKLLKDIPDKVALTVEQKEKKFEIKEVKAYKEALKGNDVDLMYKEAALLVDALAEKELIRGNLINGAASTPKVDLFNRNTDFKCKSDGVNAKTNSLEFKEFEMKDLETDTNVADASWTYANYYQSPVELNDVYQPIIQRHLNDETVVWNTLTKENIPGSAIQFRAETGRNATAGGQNESASLAYTGDTERMKYQQRFSYYYVTVRVTGQEIALAAGPGGIGDVYSMEIGSASKDLAKVLNQAIISTGAGTAENECLGFEGLILGTTGTLYGRNIATAAYNSLRSYKTNQSSAHIKISTLRTMIRKVRGLDATSTANSNAKRKDLIFFTSGTQFDKVRNEMTSLQRAPPVFEELSVGIEGFKLDSVWIVEDPDINTDDVFLVDRAHTKIGVKVPATYVEAGQSENDWRGGFIKIYFNLYSDSPGNNAWDYGYAT